MTYKIEVIGKTWGGFQSAFSYKSESAPITMAEAKRLAGDFQSIDDFRVSQISRVYREEPGKRVTVITEKTTHEWENEDSRSIFDSAIA